MKPTSAAPPLNLLTFLFFIFEPNKHGTKPSLPNIFFLPDRGNETWVEPFTQTADSGFNGVNEGT